MELKKYQREVIADLTKFIEQLGEDNNIAIAYQNYWESKGIYFSNIEENEYLRPYNNSVKGVPRVTVKVPTAGGKTFIACNALRPIFNSFPTEKPKVVAWFVPSDTILKQTYKNLSDLSHPYRQKIDSHFGSAVRVIDKESALFGQGFNPTEVKEQLTILVLSVQSFVETVRQGMPRAYRENENLAEHIKGYQYKDKLIEKADETSLIQVIAQLNPVVIIDESHNFEANLRLDMLNDINPSFMLDLTATPRNKSNIISFVDAMKLKRENMVKLPVIVYNHQNTNDVVCSAIQLQRSLEQKAVLQEQAGGRYIRPIVLFQAQPKNDKDNITFDKIKNQLVELGIPEEHIKIKTSGRDEIKNIDLLSRDCEVRYIITVNALKEGWDCPFAYVLASLANKTSKVDVEQILGRVLRLPYTTRHSEELLNLSYVFTSSDNFRETLDNIIKSLNKSGFSSKDYRVAENAPEIVQSNAYQAPRTSLFDFENEPAKDNGILEEPKGVYVPEIDTATIKDVLKNSSPADVVASLVDSAINESQAYNKKVEAAEKDIDDTPEEIKDMAKYSHIKETFKEDAVKISLPTFVKKVNTTSLFEEAGAFVPLTKSMLTGDKFDLSKEDHKIDFTRTETQAVSVGLEKISGDEYIPSYKNLKPEQLSAIRSHIISLPPESQKNQLASMIARNIKLDDVHEPQITNYIKSVIADFDTEQIADLITYEPQTVKKVKEKINNLVTAHQESEFKRLLDIGTIKCEPSFSLKENLSSPKRTTMGLTKGLYTEEGDMNDFEHRVISAIANLDNVLFWHRNLERGHGLCINGFVNHYPDFIVVMKSGRVLVVETKGDDRDNSDSRRKLDLGKTWANQAGEKYRYYMVFDKVKMDDACTVTELIGRISEM